ncbi:hypothetical protein J6590_102922 [Homalodisca vitripennis]|nr:hypothetical protein J6590_102922 [Homalodisca vitripennis]
MLTIKLCKDLVISGKYRRLTAPLENPGPWQVPITTTIPGLKLISPSGRYRSLARYDLLQIMFSGRLLPLPDAVPREILDFGRSYPLANSALWQISSSSR